MVIGDYELFKIRERLTMNIFVGEDKDFKFYSGFNWEPVQRNQYGGNMVSDTGSCQNTGGSILYPGLVEEFLGSY